MLENVVGGYEENVGNIYTSGLEMYTGIGGPKPPRAPSAPSTFGREVGGDRGSSLPDFKPIDVKPVLDGGLSIDLGKSRRNTVVLREEIGPITNVYLHHDRGSG